MAENYNKLPDNEINMHKSIAMGLCDGGPLDGPEGSGYPSPAFKDEKHHDHHIVRGHGRDPDPKKMGIVREHVRGKPSGG